MGWEAVHTALTVGNVDSIAFDGCHKIYLLLDPQQTALMRSYGYDTDGSVMYTHKELAPEQMFVKVREWFNESCFLRFVNAVRTVDGNPNDGFTTLVAQGEYDDKDAV